MTIGFDFDGVLTEEIFKKFIYSIRNVLNKDELIIITSRSEIDDEIVDIIKELELKEVWVYAIGAADYKHKAEFVAEEELPIDLFFDDDPYEVDAFSKLGIICLWIPPKEDSLMSEIHEIFIAEKYNELFGPIVQQDRTNPS